MKQEAVSMVIADRDHRIKSTSASCNMLTSSLYRFLFPGGHWREGPRWVGRRDWPARTGRRRGSCWADGRERRASKIWNIANFVSYATTSTNTYCALASHHWVINNMCSRLGMCHHATEQEGGKGDGEREKQGQHMNMINAAF